MLRGDLYKPWFLEKDKWGFEIIDGEYCGVVVQLEKLDFAEEGEEGNLDVVYHVVHKPELLSDDNVKGELFKSTFELIINDILREALDITKDEQNRNDDIKEPDSQ